MELIIPGIHFKHITTVLSVLETVVNYVLNILIISNIRINTPK